MYNSYTITVFKYIHTIPYIKMYVREKKVQNNRSMITLTSTKIMEPVKMHFQHNVSGTLCPLPKYCT